MNPISSFKNKLVIRFILATLIPVLLTGICSYLYLQNRIAKDFEIKSSLLTKAIVGEVDCILKEPVILLKHLKSSSETGEAGYGAGESPLDFVVEDSKFFESIFILDAAHKIIHVGLSKERQANRNNYIGMDMSGLSFFNDGVTSDSLQWSDTYLSALTGKLSLSLALPLKDNKILVGSFSIDHIQKNIKMFADKSGLILFITDRKGNLIFHPKKQLVHENMNYSNLMPLQQALKGVYGTFPFEAENQTYMGSSARVGNLSWFIVVAQKENLIQEPLHRLRLYFGIALIIVLGLVIALGLNTAQRLLFPLDLLRQKIKSLGQGQYQSDIPAQNYSELESLAEQFRKMAQAIKLREEQLQISEEQFRSIFENAPLALVEFDKNGVIKLCNESACEIFGASMEKLIGFDSFASNMDSKMASAIKTALSGKVSVYHDEYVSVTGNKKAYLNVNFGPMFLADGTVAGAIGVYEDISEKIKSEKEKKELESQLRQAHKMEAVGTMAGGIAHDFNNILGIIIGNTELAMDDVIQDHPAQGPLSEIKTACSRAREVVRQLLAFSRKTEQSKSPIEIESIVRESVTLLRASTPSSIAIETDIIGDPGLISADPTQIQQVIINLCTNATHAIGDEPGTITITVKQIELVHTMFKGYKTLPAGEYVQMTISDTGHGIDSDITEKIFDPYFTTKEVGKGTGMGLAVVHGIVLNHDGALSLYSEKGKGTVMQVFFPSVEAVPVLKPEIEKTIPTGSETILFVDDEPSLTRLGTQLLEKLGYKVIAFNDPVQALSYFSLNSQTIDLVITDMTMPGMAGNRLAKKIASISPGFPIILCTGFSQHIKSGDLQNEYIKEVVEKPINSKTLGRVVREILDV